MKWISNMKVGIHSFVYSLDVCYILSKYQILSLMLEIKRQ